MSLILFASALFAQPAHPSLEVAKRIIAENGSDRDAEKSLRKVLEADPAHAEAQLLLGLVIERRVKNNRDQLSTQVEPLYRAAIATLERGEARPADLALALEASARLLAKLKRKAEADALTDRAVSLRRRSVEALADACRGTTQPGKIGSKAEAPVPIAQGSPEYSTYARAAKVQGIVKLWIVVDIDGSVCEARLDRSLGFGLDEKAVEALRQWRFKPGQREGKPVPVQANVEMNFRLL